MKLTGESWIQSRERRARDIVVASALTPLSLPLVAGALAISRLKISTHPLFRQQRVGKNGELFTINKIRTMPTCTQDTPSGGTIENRANPAGNQLRLAALDELPQLLNVIKGEMSLCGPRPLIPSEIEDMKQVLPRNLFQSWQAVYRTSRPGCVSSYVNASHAKDRDFETGCFLRAELDITDFEQASNTYEARLLTDAAQTVGSAIVNRAALLAGITEKEPIL